MMQPQLYFTLGMRIWQIYVYQISIITNIFNYSLIKPLEISLLTLYVNFRLSFYLSFFSGIMTSLVFPPTPKTHFTVDNDLLVTS